MLPRLAPIIKGMPKKPSETQINKIEEIKGKGKLKIKA
jgi:hypothetical protein